MSLTPKQQLFDYSHLETPRTNWFSSWKQQFDLEQTSYWPDVFANELRKAMPCISDTSINTLSLFAGAGGLDIGFRDAGFKIVEAIEYEQKFANTLIENSDSDDTNILCMDVREYETKLKNIDFIIGGPPCQSFSAAGARAAGVNGTADDRGQLFLEYVRILNKLKPRGFLFENVYRLIGAQKGRAWEEIQEAFADIGYQLHWRVLDSADFGVPQFRERLFIVGLKEGDFLFPEPTHGPDSADNAPFFSARKSLKYVSRRAIPKKLGGRHGHLLDDIPPGLNYSFYTAKLGHPNPIFGWRTKFSDYLYKADPDTPVRTIKAQGGQYTGPFHWNSRPFSVAELKRLQTFPDTYTITGSRQTQIHQIGNSVPPQIARILACSILSQVFKIPLPSKIEYLKDDQPLYFRQRKRNLTVVYKQKALQAHKKTLSSSEVTAKDSYVSGRCLGLIDPELTLHKSKRSQDYQYRFEHQLKNRHWNVKLRPRGFKSGPAVFQITICMHSEDTCFHSAKLTSYTDSPHSYLAIWKYFEHLITKEHGVDDLIQLFGHYKSPASYTIELKILDDEKCDDNVWKMLQCVSNSHCVAKLERYDTISTLSKISKHALLETLVSLKNIGFEIRNRQTNQQIEDDEVLIPYPFPSLNRRSLQRHTELVKS